MIDDIIKRAHQELPSNLTRNPWSVTDHGRKLLQNTGELAAYLCAYGEMHKIKCLAALQNFPYEELPSTFQIVDWGCGQGIGTICMMDCLHERGILNRLRKVTLIEPSQTALSRAEENVSTALNGWNVAIETQQKYLPSNDSGSSQVTDLPLTLPGTIHLFSNILDITAVSLKGTAKLIAAGRGMQFVVCVGPMNENSPRIDEFSRFFIDSTIFSDIANWRYGITSDTMHSFSCKTKAFYFKNTTGRIADVTEGHYSESGAHDDYDLDALVRRGAISDDLLKVYKKISGMLTDDDKIFLKPDLKGDTPDIILVRRNKGIVILNVCPDDLDYVSFNPHDEEDVTSPLKLVYSYRTNLIHEHSKRLLKAAHQNKQAWFIVRPAVWFTNSTRVAIDSEFVNESRNSRQSHIIDGVITLSAEDFNSNDLLGLLDVKYNRKVFDGYTYNEVIKMLVTQWHSYKEGDSSIILTPRQKDLAKSFKGRISRIKGVAGSGKTQVMVSSAVLSQLRTGGDVLILTYNITLVNYIRYRIRKTPADFPWNKFKITNYHQFFTTNAKNVGLRLNLNSYENTAFFSSERDSLPKFSAIFIDEAQDYKPEWYQIIFDNFLEEGGEFVIFGDNNQDIYKRGGLRRVPTLGGRPWGRWNELNTKQRQTNQSIVDFCNDFQDAFLESADVVAEQQLQLSFSKEPKYMFMPSADSSAITDAILNFINEDELDPNYTVVLAQKTSLLRDVDANYRAKVNKETTTTFESKEFYDKALEEEHGVKTDRFREDIEAVGRNQKAHFTMMCRGLKLSTIYSYKGWEAENVFLIIDNNSHENTPEAIYTALTRAKTTLYIINVGNDKYHDFMAHRLP